MLRTVWNVAANLALVMVLALGAAWLIINAVSENGPVIRLMRPAELRTATVPYGGEMRFDVQVERLISCQGNVITTFIGSDATLSQSEPVTNMDIGKRQMRQVSLMLPQSVLPGEWRVRRVVDSQCPTHRQTDIMFDFRIEVGPVE